jgi:hypothetical protein
MTADWGEMMKQFSMFLALTFFLAVSGPDLAAQTPRQQRPVKNPPQYPHIIDLEKKRAAEAARGEPETTATETVPGVASALVRSVETLAIELRTLVLEMRALNVRQQAQLDLLRLTRGDLRIDTYERELKTVTERLSQILIEEQNLRAAMTPEGLAAQLQQFGTVNRDETMRQIKQNLEARVNLLQPEKERLQGREGELRLLLAGLHGANDDTERRIQLIDDALRQLNAPAAPEEKKPATPKP